MTAPNEAWKPVPGHESKYHVSDLGRVRSIDHFDGRRKVTGRILSPGTRQSGHVTVAIGKGNSRDVHSLVLAAFVGPRPGGAEILHMNHVPWDNRLSNIKYGTRSENLKMDYAVGMRTTPKAFINSVNGQRKGTHETNNA